MALALARSIARIPNLELTVLIGGRGELVPLFEAVAPTEVVPGDFADPRAWRVAAKRLVASGCTAVLCNTLVSARAIRQLHDAGLRIVQLVHELPSLIRQYGLEVASRDAAAVADVMIFPSAFVHDRFVELAGPVRGATVIRHQGLDMPLPSADERRARREATRRSLGIGAKGRMVLGVGYGDTRKGLDLWASLIRRVAERCREATFVWAGRTDPNVRHWLEHDLRQAGLESRLVLPGQIEEMADFYAAADAFVLTSREDPFPSVGIEALANGLQVFVFESSGGIVELVRNAGGVVVPYLDVNAMGDALCRLFGDKAPAENRALRSELIRRNFAFADYVAELVALAAPSRPTVSVIVPNYNYGRHLRRRLESVWAQTVPIFELIVLDDASTDDSASVIEELARESPVQMHVVRSETNSGSVSRQWARGVRMARGEVVWIAEADDFAEPEFLEVVGSAFEDPNLVLNYCESRMVDEAGNVTAPNYLSYVSDIDPMRWTADFRASGSEEVARALAIKNTIPNVSAVLFRRKALAAVLDEHLDAMVELKNAADWLCYIRLLQLGGRIGFASRALNNHRRHTASVTISNADKRHLREIAAMQDLAASVAPVAPEIREAALAYREKIAVQFGNAKESAVSLEDSVAVVMEPWATSPYYEEAEKWTHIFWEEATHFKRLFNRLDVTSVVELACGYGRHAERIAGICERLTLVDVFQENLDICAARLKAFPNVRYLKGDGHSFAGISNSSTTAIFCYDAMVHFSPEIVEAYLKDATRILQPGGRMLLHHSNYDAPTDQHYGLNPSARNHMTQKLFAQLSSDAHLLIEEQVVIAWGHDEGLDAISLLRKP